MGEFEIEIVDPVHVTLERSADPGAEWLWCIFCERFFRAKHLRVDEFGNRQGCAFCRCAGFDCAIFRWDAFREEDDPYWPRSTADLHHGLQLPNPDP